MRLLSIVLILICLGVGRSAAQSDEVSSGRALSFDGIDDFVELGNIYDDLNLPFSISAWVNLNSSAGPCPIFISQDNAPLYNGFWFFVSPTQLWIEYGDGFGDNHPAFRRGKMAPATIQTNRWVHVAAVMRSASDIDLYINGINIGGSSSGLSENPMNSNFPNDVARIGYHISNGVHYRFNGKIDHIQVFNRAVTQAEIRQNMTKKLTGNEPGLIGYWTFDELSGNTLLDKSSNHFNGVLFGNPQRVYSGAPIGDMNMQQYSASFANTVVSYDNGTDIVRASAITGNVAGVHIYEVTSSPSQTGNLAGVAPNYFGIFLASLSSGNTFDADLNARCQLYRRSDNTVANWTLAPSPLEDVANRTELIKDTNNNPIEESDLDLGVDIIACDASAVVLSSNLDPAGRIFSWNNGGTTQSITVTESGMYALSVIADCSVARDTIIVDFLKSPQEFSLGDDQELCEMTPTTLTIKQDPATKLITWQDGSHLPEFHADDFGIYWVQIENACGFSRDTIQFTQAGKPFIPLELGANIVACDADAVFISSNLSPAGRTFSWNTGGNLNYLPVTQSGMYKLTVTERCTTVRDSVFVQFLRTPVEFSLGPDEILCEMKSRQLRVEQDTLTKLITWQDGSNWSKLEVKNFGIYHVKVENACGVATDTIQITKADFSEYELPNIITPNNDEHNQFFIIDPLMLGSSIWVYNRWGKEVFTSTNYQNDWDGAELGTGVYFFLIANVCIGERKGILHIRR